MATPSAGAGRSHGTELLDRPGQDPVRLEEALEHVEQVNRWLGGIRSLRKHLGPLLEPGRPMTLLDVGSGAGGVPWALRRWAARAGAAWTVIALDRGPVAAALAARRGGGAGWRVVRGDALTLPLRRGAVDVALCTLTLHHFSEPGAVRILEEMARVSRRLVLVSDLERHPLNLAGARLLARTVWRGNPITRHDGPLSVQRSFTPAELEALGRAAGLASVRVRRHFFFRLVLEGRPVGRKAVRA